jgi:filamentous hemagglutinin
VGFGVGNGSAGAGVTVSASVARGHGNGQSTSYSNTRIDAANVTLDSGGDTTLKGAVVSANSIRADIGGALRIESLQDTASYTEKQTSAGASVTVGAGASGNVNASQSRINSVYASVGEQSGLKAGDGGFQVSVRGNTTLVGGAITSTQAAIDSGANSFSTAQLTTSDIDNKASYSARSISVSGGSGGGSAGFSNESSNSSSTTRAAISGVAGNQSARTGDKDSGLANTFDRDAARAEMQANTAITQEFGRQAPRAVADFAASQIKDIDAQIKDAAARGDTSRVTELNTEKAKWDEGGVYRVAMHAGIGGLSGGFEGAIGAGGIAVGAQTIDNLQHDLQASVANTLQAAGVDGKLAQEIGQGAARFAVNVTGAAITAGTGSAAAGMALNVDANNRQLHPSERTWAKDNAAKYREYLADKTGEQISTEEAYQRLLSAGYAVVDDAAGKTGKSDETAKRFIGEVAPAALFTASTSERANPFQNGNADGSYTPEQQARFGVATPGTRAQSAVTNALQYVGQPCTDCRTKFAAIDQAVSALQEARVLYQDDPGSVKLIDQQIDQLKSGITRDELVRGMAGTISDKDKGIAALVLGNPSRVVAGAATAETLERVTLTQAIKDARAGLPTSSLRNGGNVAAAEIDIPGLPSRMVASSRVDEAANGLIGDGSQNFTHMTLPNTEGKLIPRNTDSEYKILDNVADLLGSDTSARGSIKIVTERPACDSCLNVANQFRAKYPNIEVRVFDNNGVLLPPPRKPTGGQ